MILRFKAPTKQCGWSYQLIADIEKKTIKYGSHLFNGAFETNFDITSERELKKLHKEFLENGFTPVIEL